MSILDLAAAEASDYSDAPESFSELRPLPTTGTTAPTLPESLLPPSMRPWLLDISMRLQVPLEMAAAPAIVALSAVVGRRVCIHPKVNDDWLVTPNLWGGIIARPGRLKSPTLAEVLGPLRNVAARARISGQDDKDRAVARLASLKAKESAVKDQLKAAHKGKAPEGRTVENLEHELVEIHQEVRDQEALDQDKRFIVNDSTTEKLGELLKFNTCGLLMERDELAGWLRSLDRDDRRGDREFFLEAWNGNNPYVYDRIGRGTVQIPALCLSIVGGIQPAKLSRYVSDALDNGYSADGLLQRFQLLVWPEDGRDWRLIDRRPDFDARELVCSRFQRLSEIPAPESPEAVPALRFSQEAQALFYEWLPILEHHLAADELKACPAFESHLAKYRSLMPALALLFHVLESQDGFSAVSLEATKMAADWCGFLEKHARKVYAPELDSDLMGAHALAAKIQTGAVESGMTIREVYKTGWSHLKSAEDILEASQILERLGWARVEQVRKGGRGRPKQVLIVNPLATRGAR